MQPKIDEFFSRRKPQHESPNKFKNVTVRAHSSKTTSWAEQHNNRDSLELSENETESESEEEHQNETAIETETLEGENASTIIQDNKTD